MLSWWDLLRLKKLGLGEAWNKDVLSLHFTLVAHFSQEKALHGVPGKRHVSEQEETRGRGNGRFFQPWRVRDWGHMQMNNDDLVPQKPNESLEPKA